MNTKILIAGICTVLMITGCGESETLKRETTATARGNDNSHDQGAASVLAEAEMIYAKAKEKQHSWTITAKMIDATKKALAEGDENAAMIAAKRALFTAEASLTQAQSQEVAWQARVPQ